MFGRSKKRKQQQKAEAAEVKRLRKLLGADAPEPAGARAPWLRSAVWQVRHALAVFAAAFAVWVAAVLVQALEVSPVAVGVAVAVALAGLKLRVTDWMPSNRDAAWTLYPSVAAGLYLMWVAIWG